MPQKHIEPSYISGSFNLWSCKHLEGGNGEKGLEVLKIVSSLVSLNDVLKISKIKQKMRNYSIIKLGMTVNLSPNSWKNFHEPLSFMELHLSAQLKILCVQPSEIQNPPLFRSFFQFSSIQSLSRV